jgi:outer membrane protein assembly factor BamE
MRNLFILFALSITLSGCSYLHVHKMDIEQGNVITPEMVRQVHLGMSQDEVKSIMGEPVLANVFDSSSLDYVYTFKPDYGPKIEKYVTFIFKNNRVVDIKGNMYSQYMR